MKKSHGSIKSYTIGFAASLLLTLISYQLTVIHMTSGHSALPHEVLIPAILSLAVLQLFVQLIFFLHLGIEKKPRWNLIFFISTVSIILMVVLGSLWIMYHLNTNMMPEHVEEFIIQDEGMHHHYHDE
jgi:cytochrome o ubiquinol oxidase operon protein cyoD